MRRLHLDLFPVAAHETRKEQQSAHAKFHAQSDPDTREPPTEHDAAHVGKRDPNQNCRNKCDAERALRIAAALEALAMIRF